MAYIFITQSTSNSLVSGTSGKDTIKNGGYDAVRNDDEYYSPAHYATISAGAGNDFIYNYYGHEVTIFGGAGDDTVINAFGGGVAIFGGDGKNSIYSNEADVTISGGNGNDTIENSGNDVPITGGKGDDVISLSYGLYRRNQSKHNSIKYASGDGNDTILGFDANDTLRITKGSYTTDTVGSDFIVKVGKSKITFKDAFTDNYNKITVKNSSGEISTYNDWKIRYGSVSENYAENVTLGGSKKNDIITNYGDDVLITGGNGNDSIISFYGEDVTIAGGKGNDSISLAKEGNPLSHSRDKNNLIQYATGDGNDTIFGFNDDDTLQFTKGSYSIKVSENDVIFKVGKGSVTLKDAVTMTVNIKPEDGAVKALKFFNEISNESPNTSIKGKSTNDGRDYIQNYVNGSYVTINSGEGNDTVSNGGTNVKIAAGKGNDYITNSGPNATISGGAGNDSIYSYGASSLIQYALGDGNDTISGFDSDDTLHITKGSYSAKVSGNDVIVKVGKGKIILKYAKGKQISIKNSKGQVTTKTYDSSSANVAELFAENNFATADNLSAIVESNSTATDFKLEPKNFKNLSQENLITFAAE